MARPAPAVRRALHSDPRVLDEPGRGLVRNRRAPSHPPRRVHLSQRPQHQDPRLHRRLERPLPPLRLDQDRRPNPQERQPSNNVKSAALDASLGVISACSTYRATVDAGAPPAVSTYEGPQESADQRNEPPMISRPP